MSVVASDWSGGTIDDLVTHQTKGVDPRDADGLPYVGLEHIDTGEMSLARSGEPTAVRSRKTLFETGDILYGKLRPYLDKAVLAAGPGICSTDILVLRPKSGIDPYFAGALLHLKPFVAHAVATTSGVNHPRTSWNAIRAFEVAVPPLPEQQAIADVLRTVQRAKESTGQVVSAAQELKKSLMRQLLDDDWEQKQIGEFSVTATGGTPDRKQSEYFGGTTPWVKSGEVADCPITRTSESLTAAGLESCNARLFPTGTLLMAMYGAGVTAGRVGLLEIPAATNQAVCAILPQDHRIDSEYLFQALIHLRPEVRRARHGSNQPNLSQRIIRSLPVPIPPPEEQRRIVEIVSAVDGKITAEEARHDALAALFDSLLHDLMAARLRVTDLIAEVA